jgi:hypothetical protein
MKKYAVWQEGGEGVVFPEAIENKTGDASEASPSVQ